MISRAGIIAVISLLLLASVYFLYGWVDPKAEPVKTSHPYRATIVRSIVANGSIVPREEVRVKPQISGVMQRLLVDRGDKVKAGDVVAYLLPQPSPADVSNASAGLREAQLRLDFAKQEHDRGNNLRAKAAITESELRRLQFDVDIAQEKAEAAQRLLDIVQTGAARDIGRNSAEVRATIDGTVLERPVQVGSFVIETNTYNEGTTIIALADMGELVFKGEVDEEDAAQLSIGMPVTITVGAYPGQPIKATLDFIAPQASQRNERPTNRDSQAQKTGATTSFEVRATFSTQDMQRLRAGFSATVMTQWNLLSSSR